MLYRSRSGRTALPGHTCNAQRCILGQRIPTRINLMRLRVPRIRHTDQKFNKVVVIGGGNVAMDAARSAKRLGAEGSDRIQRSLRLPARIEEYHHAVERGVIFKWLTNPTEYVNNGQGELCGSSAYRWNSESPMPPTQTSRTDRRKRSLSKPTARSKLSDRDQQGPSVDVPELKLKWGYIEADPKTGATSVPESTQAET